jgi:hypothetical protein
MVPGHVQATQSHLQATCEPSGWEGVATHKPPTCDLHAILKPPSCDLRKGQTVDWNSICAHGSSAHGGLCGSCPRLDRRSTALAPLAVPICTRAAIRLTGKVVSFLSQTVMAISSAMPCSPKKLSTPIQPGRCSGAARYQPNLLHGHSTSNIEHQSKGSGKRTECKQ